MEEETGEGREEDQYQGREQLTQTGPTTPVERTVELRLYRTIIQSNQRCHRQVDNL